MQIYSALTAVLAALLFAFSVVQIGLCGYILRYLTKYAYQTFGFNANPTAVHWDLYWSARTGHDRSYILQTATGVLGVIISICVIVLSARSTPFSYRISGKRAPRTIAWPGISTILCALFLSLSFSSLVVTFYDSYHYGPRIVPDSTLCFFSVQQGNFACSVSNLRPVTAEGWTCGLSHSIFFRIRGIYGSDAYDVIPRTCTIATISRWWSIPLLILPFLIIASAFLEVRRKNIARYEARQQEAQMYPKEQSFSSAETASPVSPISEAPPYSLNSELHSQPRTDAEMGGKQLQEAPEKLPYDELPAERHQMYSELSASKSAQAIPKE